MLYFLFPDELLFLYADADDAGLSGGSFRNRYGECGDRFVQLYDRLALCPAFFRVFSGLFFA